MTELLRHELDRRASNRERVYQRLLQGPATNIELIEIGGTRAPGRVHEIRKQLEAEGLGTVVSEQVRGGLWRYTIVWAPPKAERKAEQASLWEAR